MAIQAKKQSPWLLLLLIVASLAIWVIDRRDGTDAPRKSETSRNATEKKSSTGPASTDRTKPRDPRQKIETQGGYEVYRGCTLVEEKNNDGDSFMVRLPDGRQAILRLYYVDAPESAFKTYRGGADNHERINEQAKDFLNTPEKIVEVGKRAKEFTLEQLGKAPFTIYTQWDSPFNDQRYHAFVQIHSGAEPQWLHEELLRNGLARFKTKPAPLPDGTPIDEHRLKLEMAHRQAIRSKVGGWDR